MEDLADRIKLTLNLGNIDADDKQRVRALVLSVRKTKRNNRIAGSVVEDESREVMKWSHMLRSYSPLTVNTT